MPTLHGVSFSGTRTLSPGDDADAVIERAESNGELVEVQPGEHVISSQHIIGGRVGFKGLGSGREDTRFTTPTGAQEMFAVRGGTLVVDNIGIDQGWNWDKLIVFARLFSGRLSCRRVDQIGTEPSPAEFGHGQVSGAFVTCGGGNLTMRDCKSTGPGDIRGYPSGRCWIYGGSSTDIDVHECDVRNTTNGCGIYANHNSSPTTVTDSYFENCAHSMVRVNGRKDTIRNTTFVADLNQDMFGHPDNRWSTDDMNRSVWCFDPKGRGGGKPLIEDCLFYTVSGHTNGVIVDGSADGARVRNCAMRSDSGAAMLNGHGIEASGGHYTGNARIEGGTIADACVADSVSLGMSTSGVTRGECSWPGVTRGQPPDGSIPDDGGGGTPTPKPSEHEIVILGSGSVVRYQFVVDGEVAEAGSGDLAGGDFDTIGTVTHNGRTLPVVNGVTGDRPGTGDTFVFDGTIVDFQFTEGSGVVEVDGQQVDPSSDPESWTAPDDGDDGGDGPTEPPAEGGVGLGGLAIAGGVAWWALRRRDGD